jgi:D-hexose-6-phosphate mutarotase
VYNLCFDTKNIAKIHKYGGHLTELRLKGENIIFMSKEAVYKKGKAIRGGIPICFPQFGSFGNYAQSHGYARNVFWDLVNLEKKEEYQKLILELTSETVKKDFSSFIADFKI